MPPIDSADWSCSTRQSGARLDGIAVGNATIRLSNTDTDRIYLADEAGLIQCLHEVEQTEPIVHDKQRKLAAMTERIAGHPANGNR